MDTKILKSCSVKLERANFAKIRIKCWAKSEQGDALKCDIKQVGANNFCIAIKKLTDSQSEISTGMNNSIIFHCFIVFIYSI